jgi:acetylornithine deacetylase/succinyl-diaminopimelate desuccinylase-like protein
MMRFAKIGLAATLLFVAPLLCAEESPEMHNISQHDHLDPSYGAVLGSAATGQVANAGEVLEVNHASDAQLAAYEQWFTENEEKHLKEVADLVAFPTLAMDPNRADELVKAGEFLKKKLTDIGMENAIVHPADGLPLVTAEWMGAEGQPTVLFYGHYDVQPADPNRWESDPFKAEIRDGKMYGRGATDDKGPIIALISAVEAMMQLDGGLPVNVMFLLDGSEEFGSQTMPNWLEKNKNWVSRADYGFSVDAMMQNDDLGLMWKGLRGGGDVEVSITSANSDLHSGIYGGAVPNAAVAASKIIASMFNDDGTVAIGGWNDGLTDLSEKERTEIAEAVRAFDPEAHKKQLDVAEFIGDKNYTLVERTWIRSSLDVTGLKSGYIEGKASIIPHSAWFRVQSRTGPGHDAEELNKKIMDHVRKNTPWGVRVEMKALDGGNAPFFSEDDLNFNIGKTVMTEYFGRPPLVLYVGGGVPALSFVPSAGGPQLVSFGFQRSDEGFHADNEFMRVSSFRTGQRAYARLIHALVDQPKREK